MKNIAEYSSSLTIKINSQGDPEQELLEIFGKIKSLRPGVRNRFKKN